MTSVPRSYSPALRAIYLSEILRFRDIPETGDFYAEFYLYPLLLLHGDDLESLSDDRLYEVYVRASLISGFLGMGLLVRDRKRKVAEMPADELIRYRLYCADTCGVLRTVDLDHPPEWLAWLAR